jgi:hypothetical protein
VGAKRRHHFSALSRRQLENGQIGVGSIGCVSMMKLDPAIQRRAIIQGMTVGLLHKLSR